MSFIVNFHYGRNFIRDYVIDYLGGYEHIIDIDYDNWSFFEVTSIVKDLSQLEHSEYWLWWYNNDSDNNIMVSDSDANDVYKYVVEMKCVMDIYIEHKVHDCDEGGVNVEDEGVVNDDDGVVDVMVMLMFKLMR